MELREKELILGKIINYGDLDKSRDERHRKWGGVGWRQWGL